MTNFKRIINVTIGSIVFKSEYLDIEADVDKSDSDDSNTCDLVIYNLKKSTREKILKGQTVIVNAGYDKTVGAIFIGGVDAVTTTKEDSDIKTSITCIDGRVVVSKTINKTYAPGVTSDTIFKDLIKQSGLEAGTLEPTKTVVYSNGKTIYGKITAGLKQIANDTNSRFYIKNNIMYILPYTVGLESAQKITSDTGLLESPSRKEDSSVDYVIYTIKTLLNPALDINGAISITSESLTGTFRITSVSHSATKDGDFTTEIEVATYE